MADVCLLEPETEVKHEQLETPIKAERKYKPNKDDKFKALNNLVVDFRQTHSPSSFRFILRLTTGLVNRILFTYHICNMGNDIVEDVTADCKSKIILKAIETYDITRGNFSTHYMWQMRSYVAYRKRYYTQRFQLCKAVSLDNPTEINEDATYHDSVVVNFHPRTYHTIKREIANIFKLY